MIVYTWGDKVLSIGLTRDYCERCKDERQHEMFCVYSVMGLFYVFNFCNNQRYFWRCTKCGTEGEADAAWVEKEFRDIPIPNMDRYGWLVFIVGFAALMLIIMMLRGNR